MSSNGCEHLKNFKLSNDGSHQFKVLHEEFVVCASTVARRRKIYVSNCEVCDVHLNLLCCLHCVFFGCATHTRDHAASKKHPLSMNLTFGAVYCRQCDDYVYDTEFDLIIKYNRQSVVQSRKRPVPWEQWNPSDVEKQLMKCHPKRLCITPHSTLGLRGLLNLGSTCFMNCIVQALMHTPLLRDYFLSERHHCKEPPSACLVCEISRLFQEFYNGTREPLALHQLLHMTWTNAQHLAKYEQQDAHEFFIATLEILHRHCRTALNSMSTTTDKPDYCTCIIDQIFTGSLQSDIVCQNCKGVSTTIDPMLDISLDLGPASKDGSTPSSLADCLEIFTRAEHLGSKSKIMCSNCQSHQESTKQFTMKTLPIVFSFHLKRFKHFKERHKKISTFISFPERLDMTPFMSNRVNEIVNGNLKPDNRYSLFAVINHLGSELSGGHYIAYIRQQYDFWYKCDDDKITRVNLREVLNSEGYLLFYHKHILEYD